MGVLSQLCDDTDARQVAGGRVVI